MQQKGDQPCQFLIQLDKVLEEVDDEIRNKLNQSLKNQNTRQKLKIVKKIIQGQGQTSTKRVLSLKCASMFVYEYIFGRLQSKPLVLNIFKVLNVSKQILIGLAPKLQKFEQMKLCIEVIQMLTISNQLTDSDRKQIIQSQLILKIYSFLKEQLEKGVSSAKKNELRNKWLDQFVEILRCLNYVLKFSGKNHQKFQEINQAVNKLAQQCVTYYYLLNKQIITQLYLILVFLNNQLAIPQYPLQQIHYFHACTIVLGRNTIKPLLKLAVQLKDTEHKAQLTQILLKSFNQYLEQGKKNNYQIIFDEWMKNNSFDYVISLFDVGRSIYSYLQQMIDIIISHGAHWSLEGNYTRKFFITKIALKHVPTQVIFQLWPNCLQDCLIQSGNMTMAYVSGCAEMLLTKLYQQLDKDYEKWMKLWIEPYKKSLLSGNRLYIRGITQFINPILLKINSNNSSLLKQILEMPQQNLNTQLGIISLIKCYKQIGKIQSKNNIILEAQQQKKKELQKAKMKQKKLKQQHKKQETKDEIKNKQMKSSEQQQKKQQQQISQVSQQKVVFVHLDDQSFYFDLQFLLNLLLSNDPMTALSTLQFLITSRKPSYLILPQQMKLIILFYKNCLKTSIPEYRKNYLNLTKRMLQRFRNNYEKDISLNIKKQNKKNKQSPYFQNFLLFLNQLVQFCFFNLYPDSIFQLTNPSLQILSTILSFFGPRGCEIRKGTFIQPSHILKQYTTFFNIQNFENLVICMQSSYESIRSIAHSIIKHFDDFDEKGFESLRKIWVEAVENTNKLSIKSYEFACRILTYVSGIKVHGKNVIKEIVQKYTLQQLNVCDYLLSIMKKRYEIFKKQFIEQNNIYYKNLIHGILTCFSYILDDISQMLQLSQANLKDIHTFLEQFFKQIIKILNFSVEISSANNSTVVLDTITSLSQTDKKMTVDCRGHFLTQKKVEANNFGNNIGNYLDSTALISSMQNQQQGIQNTLVVSFYLLTRQSGLVFQSIGGLMGNNFLSKHLPKKELIELVNTYFYALINLKHMGSVDRISNGLSKMAKVIFDQEDNDLLKVPQQLLNQLIQSLTDGKFTNILRRSAGVPFAFCCLLKSQAIKRKLLIQKTILSLLKLSQQSSQISIQLRIHSLNILKKLFQDSDLKQDLDIYVSEAFITSILGFTSQEWGVRNSSLMLFSVLANRTVGIKPTFNLFQFFHKCPDLLEFIQKQLSQKKGISMYPPLYPIVLLLSRLLPFDLRQRARVPAKGSTNKQMRKQQLLALLPLLRQAGNNHNYMGRVMTAKAILPFMHLSDIVPHCLQLLLEYLTNRKNNKINNNQEHYRLTECYQLLQSYQQIISCSDNPCYIGINEQLGNDIQKQLKQKIYVILLNNCSILYWQQNGCVSPTVQQIFIRIYDYFVSNYFSASQQNNEKYFELYKSILSNVEKLFSHLVKMAQFGDLGHSLMLKSCIDLQSICYKNSLKINKINNQKIGNLFLKYLTSNMKVLNSEKQSEIDYEILCLVFEKVVDLIRHQKQRVGSKQQISQYQFGLTKELNELLRDIDVQKVKNDDTLIRILSVVSANQSILTKQRLLNFIKKLQKVENKSQNKHLKVAIFQFLLEISPNQIQSINQSNLFLQSLLFSYSSPQQLEDLRQCCVLFLQKHTQVQQKLLIVYLRLLEDEEYEIRRRSACAISKSIGIKPCNQMVLIRELLSNYLGEVSYISSLKSLFGYHKQESKIRVMCPENKQDFILGLLLQNSDYRIRLKNHSQQRIFSYDKPNKYRTDINIFYQALMEMHPQNILNSMVKYRRSIIQGLNLQSKQQVHNYNFKIKQLLIDYRSKIMERDQYGFQTIVRTIAMTTLFNKAISTVIDKKDELLGNQIFVPLEALEDIAYLHPMFKNIFSKALKE